MDAYRRKPPAQLNLRYGSRFEFLAGQRLGAEAMAPPSGIRTCRTWRERSDGQERTEL